ncbi:hypothetical protein [Neisseria dentiae]|uniref:hypothetical protein n=1 Tax=Neisseria dentiae TaxID=194197 RepID=UPI0035A16769
MHYLWTILVALLLAACSGESYDRYVGLWKIENSDFPAVLAITKEDGKTYLINENILQETDFFGNKKKGRVLDLGEKGEMGINIGIGIIPVVLSEDGKTLRIDNRSYSKISESDFAAFKTELEQNEKLCKQLQEEYNNKRSQVKDTMWGATPQERETAKAQREKLVNEYKLKKEKIAYCRANIY